MHWLAARTRDSAHQRQRHGIELGCEPAVAVLVSGILAILSSAFAVLVSAFTLAALNLIPLPPTAPVTPSYVRSIASVSMLIRLGIAVFGIFTGIGLIRLSNWARISIVIFSGLTVFLWRTAFRSAGHTVPAKAISGRLFRASVLRDKRESFDRARWPSIRRWINRSAETKEMELYPGSRDPGLAVERHQNHFQPNLPGADAGNAVPNALPEKAVFPYSMRQLQLFWSLDLLFSILIIAMVLFYRRRFMEAACACEALPPAWPRFPRSRNPIHTCARFVIRDTGPSIPAASVCYPVEAGSLRSGIRSPHG